MKAITIARFGGPEVLTYRDVDMPKPGRGEVLVRVVAASVNPRDWVLQEGRYRFKTFLGPFPLTLGSDFSGVIDAAGPGASRFRPGAQVFGLQSRMGAFAEWIAVPEKLLAAKPDVISHTDAAAIPCAGLTAYQSLVTLGKLESGQSVLINGGAGGVGSYAIQIAKALGAHVTAVASARNAELCRQLGAGDVIDYATVDFTQTVRRQHIVLDAVGRSSFEKCRAVLAPGGHYITTVPAGQAALAALKTATLSLMGFNPRRCHAVLVRSRPADLDALIALMLSGKLRSVIAETFPLARAPEALARSKSWRTAGKLVLQMEHAAQHA